MNRERARRTLGLEPGAQTADNGVVWQLAATVITGPSSGAGQPDTRVEFTLDPLAGGVAPPIGRVVAHLVGLVRRPSS